MHENRCSTWSVGHTGPFAFCGFGDATYPSVVTAFYTYVNKGQMD